MHEVLVNRLGGLSLPRKSVVRLTDRPDMTLDVYRGRKTTMQQQQSVHLKLLISESKFSTDVQYFQNFNILLLFFSEQTTAQVTYTVFSTADNNAS